MRTFGMILFASSRWSKAKPERARATKPRGMAAIDCALKSFRPGRMAWKRWKSRFTFAVMKVISRKADTSRATTLQRR